MPVASFEPEMIRILAGGFLMGSDPQVDARAHDREQPQHTLYLPDYHIAKTPVTNAQYAAFVQSTGYNLPEHWVDGKSPEGKDNHPVRGVAWHDAMFYCKWLSEVTGRPYGLPSEAEWEKAARGTDGRIYPWGNEWDANRCNSGGNRISNTTAVDKYPQGASPYGVLDMAGNVREWTRSAWGPAWREPDFRYPYDPGDGRESVDALSNMRRVMRGGDFDDLKEGVRCTSRSSAYPIEHHPNYGFRVVLLPSDIDVSMWNKRFNTYSENTLLRDLGNVVSPVNNPIMYGSLHSISYIRSGTDPLSIITDFSYGPQGSSEDMIDLRCAFRNALWCEALLIAYPSEVSSFRQLSLEDIPTEVREQEDYSFSLDGLEYYELEWTEPGHLRVLCDDLTIEEIE